MSRLLRIGARAVVAVAMISTPLSTSSFAHKMDLKDRAGLGDAVAADSIAVNPQIYVGKRVLVEGAVDDIFGPQVFDIQKQPLLSQTMVGPGRSGAGNHGPDLLVFVPDGVSPTGSIHKRKVVEVVGTVQESMTLDPSKVVVGSAEHLSHRPVIVVEAIEVE